MLETRERASAPGVALARGEPFESDTSGRVWGGRALLQNPIAEIVVTFVFRLLFGVSDEIEFLRGRPLGDQTLLLSGCFAVKSSTEKIVSTLGPSQS